MTKEELDKEAIEASIEYANRFWGKKESLDRTCTIDNFKDGYLAGAEPREERIAALEAQIEKMKDCFNCAKGDWENRVKCIKSGCVNKSKWELK